VFVFHNIEESPGGLGWAELRLLLFFGLLSFETVPLFNNLLELNEEI